MCPAKCRKLLLALFILFGHHFECPCKLVGAGGWFAVAADSFEAGDYVAGLHPFGKFGYTLGVAAAAAHEFNVDYGVVAVELNGNCLCTHSLCAEYFFVVHNVCMSVCLFVVCIV